MADGLRRLDHDTGLSLVCRSGGRALAVPLQHVAETMRPLATEPLAGAPAFVVGVSLIRGAPTPVVDVAALFGGVSATAATRFVTLRAGARHVALAVDAVVGIRAIDRATIEAVPPLLAEAAAELVEAMGRLDAELLLVLRGARVLTAAAWAALDAERTS